MVLNLRSVEGTTKCYTVEEYFHVVLLLFNIHQNNWNCFPYYTLPLFWLCPLELDFNVIYKYYGYVDLEFFCAQEKCCGVYGYKDWQRTRFTQGNHSIVPDSCCKEVKTHCGEGFQEETIHTEVTQQFVLCCIHWSNAEKCSKGSTFYYYYYYYYYDHDYDYDDDDDDDYDYYDYDNHYYYY